MGGIVKVDSKLVSSSGFPERNGLQAVHGPKSAPRPRKQCQGARQGSEAKQTYVSARGKQSIRTGPTASCVGAPSSPLAPRRRDYCCKATCPHGRSTKRGKGVSSAAADDPPVINNTHQKPESGASSLTGTSAWSASRARWVWTRRVYYCKGICSHGGTPKRGESVSSAAADAPPVIIILASQRESAGIYLQSRQLGQ